MQTSQSYKFFQFNFTCSIFGLLSLVCLAGCTLLQVYFAASWPQNHEYDGFFQRTLVYAQHFEQHDYFPIWSTADNYDLGSPQPALYHKLFYLSAGILFWLTGLMKESILLCIWFWLIIGGLGMYQLCRVMKSPRVVAWCGACMLVVANYTITDWLIRGAMAELCAMMLIPWFFAIYIQWLHPNHATLKNYALLGFVMGLIFLAHSVMAYYIALLIGISTVILVVCGQVPLKQLRPHFVIWALLTFGCIAGPYLLAIKTLGQGYDLHRLLIPPFLPEYSIKPISQYIWDMDWIWGAHWDRYTVQLDTPILILLTCGIMYQIARLLFFSEQRKAKLFGTQNEKIGFLALILCALLTCFLQTQWAIGFYQTFPGAKYLQFSWRLLAVLTPLLIVLSLASCSNMRLKLRAFFISISFISMVICSGAWAQWHYDLLPAKTTDLKNLTFGWNKVYIPSQVTDDPSTLSRQVLGILTQKNCSFTDKLEQNQKELLIKRYLLSCVTAGQIPLPLFTSPLHQLLIIYPNDQIEVLSKCIKSESYPGLCTIKIERPGTYEIKVIMPTFGTWIKSALL